MAKTFASFHLRAPSAIQGSHTSAARTHGKRPAPATSGRNLQGTPEPGSGGVGLERSTATPRSNPSPTSLPGSLTWVVPSGVPRTR